MSLKTWKKEFYPVSAEKCSKEKAAAHSLQKWKGLAKENLKKHNVVALDGDIVENGEWFEVNSDSCALCVKFYKIKEYDPCFECPLYKARKNTQCDLCMPRETMSPFDKWLMRHNPSQMIKWLEKAVAL